MQEDSTKDESTKDESTKNAAIYVRDSSTGPDAGNSLQAQTDACNQHCSEEGAQIDTVYSDANGSREAFDRMMADATDGTAPFDHIVVWEASRFSRSAQEFTDCEDRLNACGVQVVSVK